MKKILFTFAFLALGLTAWAEVSPLPEAQFTILYNKNAPRFLAAKDTELVLCDDRLCMEPKALGVYGSQRMKCNAETCTATAYEFEPFARLAVTFEDGTPATSNIFTIPDTLISRFNVYVDQDGVQVVPVENPVQEPLWKRPQAWSALTLILVLELLCATAYIIYTKKRFTILYGVAVANILTAALTWCVLVHYIAQSALWWVVCVVLETFIIRLLNRKDISLKDSATLCIITNVTSYTLGMILSFMWAQF